MATSPLRPPSATAMTVVSFPVAHTLWDVCVFRAVINRDDRTMNLTSVIDQPRPGSAHYRQYIPVAGWIHAGEWQDQIRQVTVCCDGRELGTTAHLFVRTDVALSLQLQPDLRTGFRLLAVFEPPPHTHTHLRTRGPRRVS